LLIVKHQAPTITHKENLDISLIYMYFGSEGYSLISELMYHICTYTYILLLPQHEVSDINMLHYPQKGILMQLI